MGDNDFSSFSLDLKDVNFKQVQASPVFKKLGSEDYFQLHRIICSPSSEKVLFFDIHEIKVRWTRKDSENLDIRVDNIAKYCVLKRYLTKEILEAYPKFDDNMNIIGT